MDVANSDSCLGQIRPPRRPRLRRVGIRCAQGVGLGAILIVVAFAAAWRYAAGHLPAEWVRDRLVGVIETATGGRANVALKSARISSSDDGPRLVLDGFALHDSSGRTVVGAPRAEIAFDLWTLLFGTGAMRRVELHDVEVKLALDRDGRIALTSTQPSGEMATAASDWRGLVGSVAGALSGKDSAIAGLDRFALRNGRLVVDDPANGTQVRYDDIAIDLDSSDGGRRLSIAARGRGRDWSIVAASDARASDILNIDMAGLPLADLGSLLRLPVVGRDSAGLSGRLAIKTNAQGEPQAATVDVSNQGGVVFAPGGSSEVALTGFALQAAWSDAERKINVAHAAIKTGAASVEIAGAIATPPDGGAWGIDIASGKASVRSLRAGAAPIEINRIKASAAWRGGTAIVIPSWLVGGKDFELRGDGNITAAGEAGASNARLSASSMDMLTALSLWPVGLAEDARIYLTRTIERGRLDRLDILAKIDEATRADLFNDTPLPRDALLIDVAASQTLYRPLEDFPPLEIDAAQAKIDGRTLTITAPALALEGPAKQRVTATDARFAGGHSSGAGPSRVEFRIKGPAEPVFDLLDTPLLKKAIDLGDDLDITKGAVDLKLALGFPINAPVRINDVAATLSGSMSGVTIEGAVPNESITDVRATLSFDRGEFAMKGDGRLLGAATGIEVKRGANGVGEAALSIMLDEAARAKRGLPSGHALSGPTPVKITRVIGGAKPLPAKVDIDLARAAVNGVVPGWLKPAGRPGRVSFAYAPMTKSSDIELQDFSAESAGFALKGVVTLNSNNALRAAKFSQARLSPGDDARIDWERNGSSAKITIRGNNIDARPILRGFYEAPRDSSSEISDLEIDLRSAIFTGHNNEAATNVELRAAKRGAELRQFSLSGRFGKADLRGQLARRADGQPRVVIESADAGAFLRFIDLYRRMVGGKLSIDVGSNDARQDGQLVVKDFVLRNEPALRQASAAQPANDVGDTSRVTRARETARGDVEFEKVRVDFVRGAGRIDIKDGVMWGPMLGVQFEGIVDAPRDRVDVTGTYVPAYALNNAFAQVPVVGLILGGGQYGGLFGVNFKVSGAFSQPTVAVNPLSALTPGVFRRFLEFNKQSVEGRAAIPPRDLGAARAQ